MSMSDEPLARWLRTIEVDTDGQEIAMAMGLLKPSDFRLFSSDELCEVYGFSAVSARKIILGIVIHVVPLSVAVFVIT